MAETFQEANVSVTAGKITAGVYCPKPDVLPCVWHILRSFVFLCGLSGYSFVGYLIYRLLVRYKTPYYAFTFSLAVCNSLVIVYNLIVTPLNCAGLDPYQILQVAGKFLEMTSYLHIVGISLTRLTAVVYIQDCPSWLKRSARNLAAVWVCGVSWGIYHSVSVYLYNSGIVSLLCTMRYAEFVVCMTIISLIFSFTLATGYNLWHRKSLLERTPSRKISAYRRQVKLFIRCFIQCSLLFYTIVTELTAVNTGPDQSHPDVYYGIIIVGKHLAYTAFFVCPPILCISFDNLVQHAAMAKAI